MRLSLLWVCVRRILTWLSGLFIICMPSSHLSADVQKPFSQIELRIDFRLRHFLWNRKNKYLLTFEWHKWAAFWGSCYCIWAHTHASGNQIGFNFLYWQLQGEGGISIWEKILRYTLVNLYNSQITTISERRHHIEFLSLMWLLIPQIQSISFILFSQLFKLAWLGEEK